MGDVRVHGGPVKGWAFSPFLFHSWQHAAASYELKSGFTHYRAVGSFLSEKIAIEKFNQASIVRSEHFDKLRSWAVRSVVHQLKPFISAELSPIQRVVEYSDFSTNPGYPWLLWHPTKMSAWLDRRFQESFQSYFDSQFTDSPMLAFTKFFLKGELRTLAKMLDNDQRVIAGVAFEHVLSTNVFDLDFNQQLYASACQTFSCAGMSMMHHGMDRVVQRLSRFPNAYELDAFRHEMTFHEWLHEDVASVRKALYAVPLTPYEEKGYDNLVRQKYSGPMLDSTGSVYWLPRSQKSGQSSTLPDNTLGSELRFEMCFCDLWLKAFGVWPTIRDYLDNVVTVVVGDDLNFSCSDHVSHFFNMYTISHWFFKEMNLIMKTDHWEPQPASSLSFLSHVPVLQKTSHVCHVPVLDYSKLCSSLFLGGQDFTFLGDLRRLVGLRIVGWTNLKFRTLCDYVLRTLVPFFPLWQGSQEFRDIMNGWLPDDELFELWHAAGL